GAPKPASAGCGWPTPPATRPCRSAPFAAPLPDGLRVGRYRGEVGREAQERLARLAEDRLELGVLDLQEREAAGSLGVGLGPVDGREDAVGVVVRHLVDGVDDLLAGEIAPRRLGAPPQKGGVEPPHAWVLLQCA